MNEDEIDKFFQELFKYIQLHKHKILKDFTMAYLAHLDGPVALDEIKLVETSDGEMMFVRKDENDE